VAAACGRVRALIARRRLAGRGALRRTRRRILADAAAVRLAHHLHVLVGRRVVGAAHLRGRRRPAALHTVGRVRALLARRRLLGLARAAAVVVRVVLLVLLLGGARGRALLDVLLDRHSRVRVRNVRLRRVRHDVVGGAVGGVASLIADEALCGVRARRGAAVGRGIVGVTGAGAVGRSDSSVELGDSGGVLVVAPGGHNGAGDGG